MYKKPVLLLVLTCLLFGSLIVNLNFKVSAATLVVTNNADSGSGSLRQTIANASSGDTITFDPSLANQTIILTSGKIQFLNKDLTIDGINAPNLTLSGNNTSGILRSVNNDLTVKNLTFINGYEQGPGGAVQGGVNLTPNIDLNIINCVFKNNRAEIGGAVYSGYRANLLVENSIFDNNDGTLSNSGFSAGAIAKNNEGTVIIRNSVFTNNKGVSGGAVYNLLSPLTVENSVFLNNTSTGGGGAIFTDGGSSAGPNPQAGSTGGTIRISNSKFENNSSYAQGGALYLFIYELDNVLVENSIIKNNTVQSPVGINQAQGGGLRANGNTTIKNVAFIDNYTDKQGGGLWLDGYLNSTPATVNVENSTFSGNRAGQSGQAQAFGGAITTNPSAATTSLNITNSTIANNEAGESGGAFWIVGAGQKEKTTLKNTIVTNNKVSGNASQTVFTMTDGGGNIEFPFTSGNKVTTNSQVIDPKLDILTETGGTFVHPLLSGSPAINTAVSGSPTTDQRGVSRDSQPDIGAYEYVLANNTPGVIINQTNSNTTVTEGGNTDSYSIVLNSQPSADVTINFGANNQLTTDVSSVTFTPQNWNIPQNILVTAIDDTAVEGNQTTFIQHTVISSDANYNNLPIAPFAVSILDNDSNSQSSSSGTTSSSTTNSSSTNISSNSSTNSSSSNLAKTGSELSLSTLLLVGFTSLISLVFSLISHPKLNE